jgi:hypothetical protein
VPAETVLALARALEGAELRDLLPIVRRRLQLRALAGTSMGKLSNPIHIDTIVPGTATVLTTDELPARRLHRALTACLKGTTN